MPVTAFDEEYRKRVRNVVSDNIKRIMDDRHETNGSLSQKMGISQSLLSHYANGSRMPGVDVLLKMCDALGFEYSVDDFAYFDGLSSKQQKINQLKEELDEKVSELADLQVKYSKLSKEAKQMRSTRRVNINDYPENKPDDDYDMYKFIAESLPYRDFQRYKKDYESQRK